MAKQGNDGWVNDAADLFSEDFMAAYKDYKDAYEVMKEARDQVEAIALAELAEKGMGEDKTALFGYRWGFSFKVVAKADKKQAKAAKPQINLAQYFAAQDQSGMRR